MSQAVGRYIAKTGQESPNPVTSASACKPPFAARTRKSVSGQKRPFTVGLERRLLEVNRTQFGEKQTSLPNGVSSVASRSITSSSERHVVTTPPARVAIHVAQSGADMSTGGCNR